MINLLLTKDQENAFKHLYHKSFDITVMTYKEFKDFSETIIGKELIPMLNDIVKALKKEVA